LDPHAKLGKISTGRLEEADRTLLALISQDLHEREPRRIVDADMDKLPTDAVVAVDRARISSSDTMAYGADPSELFDVEMDEFAWSVALVASDRFGRLQGTQLIQPQTAQNTTDSGG